jgi:hypothetical protein
MNTRRDLQHIGEEGGEDCYYIGFVRGVGHQLGCLPLYIYEQNGGDDHVLLEKMNTYSVAAAVVDIVYDVTTMPLND